MLRICVVPWAWPGKEKGAKTYSVISDGSIDLARKRNRDRNMFCEFKWFLRTFGLAKNSVDAVQGCCRDAVRDA